MEEWMTPRERVLACYEHREPDRVPLHGSFRREVWEKLCKFFATDDRSRITELFGFDFAGVGVNPDPEWLERSRPSPYGYGIPHPDGSIEDASGVRRKHLGPYMRYLHHPLSRKQNLDTYRFPDYSKPLFWEGVEKRIKELKKNYVVSAGTGTFFRDAWHLRGLESWLCDIASDEAFVRALLDRMLEYKLQLARGFAQRGIDVFSMGGDIAMHTGPFMSPKVYRRLFQPYDATLINECKKYGVKHFYLHSDGNLMPILEDLIDAGITIINPVQPECMDPYQVKKKYGDKLVLDGTISSQHTLPFGTVEDVRREVEERIEFCGRDGGLIIAPNNVVQFDVPIENLLTVYETARSYARPRRH